MTQKRAIFKSFAELKASDIWGRMERRYWFEQAERRAPVMSFERFETDRKQREDTVDGLGHHPF